MPQAAQQQMNNQQPKLVTLVDEDDQVIGEKDLYEAHRYPVDLHRAVSVFLFRRRDDVVQLLMQQRSEQKIVGALQWGNTICGNVRPGESYEECAHRRLREELGIEGVELTPIYKLRYETRCNDEYGENEIDQMYAGWYDGGVELNPDEVADYHWMEFVTAQSQMDTSPWYKLFITNALLLSRINNFIKV